MREKYNWNVYPVEGRDKDYPFSVDEEMIRYQTVDGAIGEREYAPWITTLNTTTI